MIFSSGSSLSVEVMLAMSILRLPNTSDKHRNLISVSRSVSRSVSGGVSGVLVGVLVEVLVGLVEC